MRERPPPFPWPVSEIAGIAGFLIGVTVVFGLTRSLPVALIAGTLLGGIGALLAHPGAALAYLALLLTGALLLLAWAVLRPGQGAARGPEDFRPERLRFFESGPEHPPPDGRVYARSFNGETARYVCWQLDASFSELPQRVPIRIDYVYFNPDGTALGRAAHATHLEKGWVESWHSRCWGWDAPGGWSPGTYRVDLLLDDEPLVRGRFAIH